MLVDPDAPDPAEPVRPMRAAARARALTPCVPRRRQTFRSWLHWLVVDLPGGAEPAKGRTLMQYKGPSPPKGVHRCVAQCVRARALLAYYALLCARSYVFLLYQQPAELGAKAAQKAAPPERNSFDVRRPRPRRCSAPCFRADVSYSS